MKASKCVLVPLLSGFEEIEAVTIIDVLRRADIDVVVAGESAGPVTGSHGIDVGADVALAGLGPERFDAVVLPGGMPGAAQLREHSRVQALLGQVADRGKLLAAVCAAPMALSPGGHLRGRRFTCYPGFESQVDGGPFSEDRVVVDGNVITSRGPGTALEFALQVVAHLVGPDRAGDLGRRMLAS